MYGVGDGLLCTALPVRRHATLLLADINTLLVRAVLQRLMEVPAGIFVSYFHLV